jgi:hypothetical protein
MSDKRKRAAPTIDLTATEVAGAEAAKPEGAPAQEPPPPPETKAEVSPPPEPPQQDAKAEMPPPEPPVEQHSQPGPFKSYLLPIAAGFAGAIIGGAVVWALLPAASNDGAQTAALQKQIDELKNRPAPDTQAIDALRQSVRKLESDIAKLPPGDATVAARLAAADNAMKSLGVALAALNTRSDTIAAQADKAQQSAAAAEKAVADLRDSVQHAAQRASTADTGELAALQKRVAALEESVKSAREQIANVPDRAARLALSAAALRDAVESGAPYQAELAQAKALGADEHDLAPLQEFAASGVPSPAALTQELRALLPAMLGASGAPTAPAGFLERLQANASKIVRISPAGVPQGDVPADVLARIEIAAAHADLDGALADLAKLPEVARAPAQILIAKVNARREAVAAARRFAASTARALGQPPSADALRRP